MAWGLLLNHFINGLWLLRKQRGKIVNFSQSNGNAYDIIQRTTLPHFYAYNGADAHASMFRELRLGKILRQAQLL